METFPQKGLFSTVLASVEKETPANGNSWFSDVTPDEAQQGPNPRQSLDMQFTGAPRHPCASQPGDKFTVALVLDLSSAGSCYVITGSFILMRIPEISRVVNKSPGCDLRVEWVTLTKFTGRSSEEKLNKCFVSAEEHWRSVVQTKATSTHCPLLYVLYVVCCPHL